MAAWGTIRAADTRCPVAVPGRCRPVACAVSPRRALLSYYEHVTTNFERLSDPEWEAMLSNQPPAEVPWMNDLVVQ